MKTDFWQLINTAPRDGTPILAFGHGKYGCTKAENEVLPPVMVVIWWRWHHIERDEDAGNGLFRKVPCRVLEGWHTPDMLSFFTPSHWMALPDSPEGHSMNPTPTTPAPQAGHTPGPWTVEPTYQGALSEKCKGFPFSVNGADGFQPALIFGDGQKNAGTAQANARLIAAAPALLAFAQRALRIFLAWQHDANPDGDLKTGESADFDAATLNVEAARAALAQAEGRA